MTKNKKYKKRVLVRRTLLVLTITIVMLEIILRLFFYERLKLKIEPLAYKPSEQYGFLPIPHAKVTKSAESTHRKFALNAKGFIGRDFTAKKDQGIFRIIVAGFSNCEGYFVSPEENCLLLLENKLKQSGYKAEVLNCSIGGGYYRKIQQYNYVKDSVSCYDADLVLFETDVPFSDYYVSRDVYKGFTIEYSTNSGNSKRAAREIVDCIQSHRALTAIYDYCYIARAISKWYSRQGNSPGLFEQCLRAYINNKVKFEGENTRHTLYSNGRSIALLQQLQEDFRQNGTTLACFRISEPGQATATDKFNTIMKGNNMPYLNIWLEGTRGRPFYYNGNGHLNPYGHQLLAAALFDEIIKRNYIPVQYKAAN